MEYNVNMFPGRISSQKHRGCPLSRLCKSIDSPPMREWLTHQSQEPGNGLSNQTDTSRNANHQVDHFHSKTAFPSSRPYIFALGLNHMPSPKA